MDRGQPKLSVRLPRHLMDAMDNVLRELNAGHPLAVHTRTNFAEAAIRGLVIYWQRRIKRQRAREETGAKGPTEPSFMQSLETD